MGDEPVNAPNTNATQKGEINEHQNVVEPIVQRDLVALSNHSSRNTTNNNPIEGGECS
jgi:hypothetical protein